MSTANEFQLRFFISLVDCNIDNIAYFQQQQNDRALHVTRSAVLDYY